jgi:hypothetical protein
MRRAGPLCLTLLLAAAGGGLAQDDLPPPPGGDVPVPLVFEPLDPPRDNRPADAIPGGNLIALATLLDSATPLGLGARVPFAYSALWEPSRPVRNQPADLGSFRQDAVLRLPLLLDGPDSFFGSAGLRHVYTDTSAVLPDSGRGFPKQLWDLRAGILYRRDIAPGWAGGAGITVSSPSDKPFRDGREVTYSVLGFLQTPTWVEGDNWLFTLSYSPVGESRYPVPGVAYQWNPSGRLQATIGVPTAVTWRPTDRLRFDAGWVPLRRVRAQVTWEAARCVEVFAGFEWWNEAYLLTGRQDKDEQLFYYEKRIPAGVRFHVLPNGVLDVAAGYGFDRLYFTGRDYGDRGHDRIDVAPGVFLQVRFAYRF